MKNNLIVSILESIPQLTQRQIETKMMISSKISNSLKTNNITKKQFLKLLGKKHQSEISKWLSGTHNFTVDTLVEIEETLKIKLLNIEHEEPKLVNYQAFQITVCLRANPNKRLNNNWIKTDNCKYNFAGHEEC